MKESQISNRRIARNAIYLYIRTFVIMLVTLYTSRVVLKALGTEDYGIYNVVGGIVVLFSVVTTSMTVTTQRFLNYELGHGDINATKNVFCMSMNLYLAAVVLIIMLGETIGLWFLNTQLNIPDSRMSAAQWVYQFSIATCCVSLLRIPYNASIIAYEKMSFYAYVSIIEAVLKLGIVYMLLIMRRIDLLILYAALILVVTVIVNIIYYVYCHRTFSICQYRCYWNRDVSRKLVSFSSWTMLGSFANAISTQGAAFIMNIFCGVIVNAAMGIAGQVHIAVVSFVSGFQTAFNPQLIKSYAAGDRTGFLILLNRSSRFSYYLMLVFALPLFIWCREVLNLWLIEVPEFTVEFTRLTIIYCLIDSLSNPLWTSIGATGKIRFYQIWVSALILLNLPISYLLLKIGFSPITVLITRVSINGIVHLGRVIHLRSLVGLSVRSYTTSVMLRCAMVTTVVSIFSIACYTPSAGMIQWMISFITTILVTGGSAYFLGLSKNERKVISAKKLSKHKHKQ